MRFRFAFEPAVTRNPVDRHRVGVGRPREILEITLEEAASFSNTVTRKEIEQFAENQPQNGDTEQGLTEKNQEQCVRDGICIKPTNNRR